MDEETQRILQRSRERRQALNAELGTEKGVENQSETTYKRRTTPNKDNNTDDDGLGIVKSPPAKRPSFNEIDRTSVGRRALYPTQQLEALRTKSEEDERLTQDNEETHPERKVPVTPTSTSQTVTPSESTISYSSSRSERLARLAAEVNEREDDLKPNVFYQSKEAFVRQTPPRRSWGTPKSQESASSSATKKALRFASPIVAVAMADESVSTYQDSEPATSRMGYIDDDVSTTAVTNNSNNNINDTMEAESTLQDPNACGIETFYRRKKTPMPEPAEKQPFSPCPIEDSFDQQTPPVCSTPMDAAGDVPNKSPVRLRPPQQSSGAVPQEHRISAKISEMATFWEAKFGGGPAPPAHSQPPPQLQQQRQRQPSATGSSSSVSTTTDMGTATVAHVAGTVSFVGDAQRRSMSEEEIRQQVRDAKEFWQSGLRGSERTAEAYNRAGHEVNKKLKQTPEKQPTKSPLERDQPSPPEPQPRKPSLSNKIPDAPPLPQSFSQDNKTKSIYRSGGSIPKVETPQSQTKQQQQQPVKQPTPVSEPKKTQTLTLRQRWELSSATGVPLGPDTDNDELTCAAVRLARSLQPRRPVKSTPSMWLKSPPSKQPTPVRQAEDRDSSVTSRRMYDSPASDRARSATPTDVMKAAIVDEDNAEVSTAATAGTSIKRRRTLSTGDVNPNDSSHIIEYIDEVFEAVNCESPFRNEAREPAAAVASPDVRSILAPVREEQQTHEHTPNQVRHDGADVDDKSLQQQTPLMHSVSFYRSQQKKRTSTMSNQTPISVKTASSSSGSVGSLSKGGVTVEQEYEKRIRDMNKAVNVQQEQIAQASQALNFCRTTMEFKGSREEVDAQRALLLATERRRALLIELDRVTATRKQRSSDYDSTLPTGTLTISHISVPLKREFVNNNFNQNRDIMYYFICLVKHADQVYPTQLVTSDEGLHSGMLEFQHYIKMSALKPDFQVRLEIYALRTKRESIPHEAKYRIKGMTLAKIRSKSSSLFSPGVHSPGGPIYVLDPSFQLIGHLSLSLPAVNRNKFKLDAVQFSSPIEGSAYVKLRCYADSAGHVQERGFLNLYEEVSGYGSWTRYWTLLKDGVMRLWRYPDDEENRKDPLAVIDLAQCICRQVLTVSREECARPHTFRIDLLPDATNDGPAVKNTVKIILSGDSKEDFVIWTTRVNETLRNLQMWNPDMARQQASKK